MFLSPLTITETLSLGAPVLVCDGIIALKAGFDFLATKKRSTTVTAQSNRSTTLQRFAPP